MAVKRTSTVAAEARAASRERRSALLEARRQREERISQLADAHAVALALADAVQARADVEIARHRADADANVVELLKLEKADAVAELLGMTASEVRTARRRVGDAGDLSTAGTDAGVASGGGDAAEAGAEATGPSAGVAAAATVKAAKKAKDAPEAA